MCGGAVDLPCPVHAVLAQLQLLIDIFGPAKVNEGELPVFPSLAGGFVEKRHVVACIEAAATILKEPLAGLGIEIHLIQLMARWSSDVVYRYVAEAPLSRMTAAYRRGYSSQAALEACPSCPSQLVHKESEELSRSRTSARAQCSQGRGSKTWTPA